MTATQPSSTADSPEAIAVLQQVFEDVWNTLYAHVPLEDEVQRKELGIKLSQTLVGLAADGVIDPRELHRKAVESMILSIR